MNLSKLFSIYGPNSNIKKKVPLYSSRVRSSENTKRTYFEDKTNMLSVSNRNFKEPKYLSEDEEEILILKLMSNMFMKKKSVKEKI